LDSKKEGERLLIHGKRSSAIANTVLVIQIVRFGPGGRSTKDASLRGHRNQSSRPDEDLLILLYGGENKQEYLSQRQTDRGGKGLERGKIAVFISQH